MSPDFYDFAAFILKEYKDDKKIFMVSSDGRANKNAGRDNEYYCTKYPSVWGWATWRDRWELVDRRLYGSFAELTSVLNMISTVKIYQDHWSANFKAVHMNEIDTWDFHLAYYQFKHAMKTIIPSNNLMQNVGFDHQATHTTSPNRDVAKLELGSMKRPYTSFQNLMSKNLKC